MNKSLKHYDIARRIWEKSSKISILRGKSETTIDSQLTYILNGWKKKQRLENCFTKIKIKKRLRKLHKQIISLSHKTLILYRRYSGWLCIFVKRQGRHNTGSRNQCQFGSFLSSVTDFCWTIRQGYSMTYLLVQIGSQRLIGIIEINSFETVRTKDIRWEKV